MRVGSFGRMFPAVGAARPASIVDEPLQQPDGGGNFLLLSR
jgi:hypothetical protein